ncbi:MAG: imelysin family protein, partial [Pseudomonadota bacterium]
MHPALVRPIGVAAAALFALATPSLPAHTKSAADLASITQGMIEGHIQPSYLAFVEAANAQTTAMNALCEAPSEDALLVAQTEFKDLVVAWSAVEFIRFGPAREENRYERLFFWPDRNGRGLRQVQGVIGSEDETVTTQESLQGKSVALQGLPALEFVLFGTGSEGLATGEAAHRCAYGAAIAPSIADVAGELSDAWQGFEGYAGLMLAPGPDNPIYRTEGEAMQELLRAMSEQMEILNDAKLARVVGESLEEVRPRRASFWRADASFEAMAANVAAILSLNEAGQVGQFLPEQSRRFAGTLEFELNFAARIFNGLADQEGSVEEVLADETTYGQFAGADLPLSGAFRIVDQV